MTVSPEKGKLVRVPNDAADSPQIRPGPPPPNIAFLTMAVGRRVRVRVDTALAAHGLTYRHLSALGHLAGNADASYAELARRGGVTTQSIQATLAQLQHRGAVEQRNTPKRGQRAQLGLTPAGAALLELGTAALDTVARQLAATLPDDQHEPLGGALLTLLSALIRQDDPATPQE